MKNSKRIILPALALAGVIAVSSLGVGSVRAMEGEQGLPLIQRIAERFGLNQSEVEEVFTQYRVEHQVEMQARFEEKLAELVTAGTLTQEQADAMTEKHEEMRADHEALLGASPEERKAYAQANHDEMEAWASEQGIDSSLFRELGPEKGRGGHGMGRAEGAFGDGDGTGIGRQSQNGQ